MAYDNGIIKEQILKAAFDDKLTPQNCAALWHDLCIEKPILFLTHSFPMIVRCSYNQNGEVFNNIKRLSYNPFWDKVPLQRCNYAAQSVFYGATGFDNENASAMATAIVEVCLEYIKQNDMDTHYMTLSRWRIAGPMPVFLLPYSPLSVSKNPEFRKAKEHFDTMIIDLANDYKVSVQHLTEYLEFIGDIFIKREDKSHYYKISSAYVNYIMNYAAAIGQRVDGLLYPSANTEAAGMNIVLHPDVINSKFVYADMAVMYKAQRRPGAPKHFDFARCSNEATIEPDGKFSFTSIW